jgi:ABC-type protease/lipase transport system fused ATPase/permease subunit
MQTDARLAGRFVDQSLGNAEVVGAMGMVGNVTEDWREKSQKVLSSQLEANQIGSFLTSTTRFLRQILQVIMLAVGAWLTIQQLSTPGVMIAATIILGRALAPVESLIAGWKSLVEARGAYVRLGEVFAAEDKTPDAMELPAPMGALSVENVVFGFRGQELPIIRRVSFEPGRRVARDRRAERRRQVHPGAPHRRSLAPGGGSGAARRGRHPVVAARAAWAPRRLPAAERRDLQRHRER